MAGIGAVILVGMIGYLVFEAVVRPPSLLPDIIVEAKETIALEDRYLLRIVVANRGNTTGADVNVIGALFDGDRLVEQSRVTFDFVPPRSRTGGGLYFTVDPAAYALVVRAEGFTDP